jgi:hypothetical protein
MCERTESANTVREAAKCLSRVCYDRTLRAIYGDTVKEGIPPWAAELLNKMK